MHNGISAKLTALREEADRMATCFHNELGAAGMRYAIHEIEQALTGDRHRLVGPGEASALSGYSTRQLRRLVGKRRLTNYGRSGAPRYRVSELPLKPGHHPESDRIAETVTQQGGSALPAAAQSQVPNLQLVEPLRAPATGQAIGHPRTTRGRDAALESHAREMAGRLRPARLA
jgi:hypothetical protein